MANPETNPAAIINSGDPALIARVETHLGSDFLTMSPEIAAQFDTGDLGDSDPRLRTANKVYGEFTGKKGNR
jgi:hypothetical protein